MEKIQRAVEKFRKPYSCAQTVYAAFKDAGEEKLADLKANSSGKAARGLCGAVYAARLLVSEDKRGFMEAEFAAAVGDARCREIKTVHKTPCEACVKIAAELVEKYSR
ncbi:MAG: hypothetical protein PHH26_02875 [Candidatus Thermoplasmatota archaeon]|nr:hypothetical protein [Candidatus Thermoplasmatota archaeon]